MKDLLEIVHSETLKDAGDPVSRVHEEIFSELKQMQLEEFTQCVASVSINRLTEKFEVLLAFSF